MNRGVVLSVDSASAIVFTSECRLIKVPSRQGVQLGQEIIIETPKVTKRSGSRILRPLLAFAAAVFAVIAGVIISQSILTTRTYAVLSVDVNPSLQFSLNQDLIVTDVEALNADAGRLLIKESYKGLSWQEAVDRWLLLLEENGYEEIGDVLISAVMPEKDEALVTQLMLFEETAGEGDGSQMRLHIIYSHDGGVSESARKNGLSVGMQMLVNQSAAQQGPWTADNIKATPLGELVRLLAQDGQMDQTRITVNKPSDTTRDETDSGDSTKPGTPAETRPSADPTKPSTPAETRPSADPTEPDKEPSGTTERTIPSNSNATKPKPTPKPKN
ncbi:MAG: anti-sigma factor domain-containing protein [Clostridiales bacterium]|nr:anti-sigma factor domain-containing protein [Clostridiales bacterium]